MAFNQLFAGRDEAIIDPDLAIIDAHHHLFDRPGLRYLFHDYLADTRAGHRIVASVFVETKAFSRLDGPEMLRSLGEIEFANGAAAMGASGLYGECRVGAAIVGYADLRFGNMIGDYLDQAIGLAPGRFRGIRQIANDHPTAAPYQYMPQAPPRGLLRDAGFQRGFRQLADRGLSFDAAAFHHQLGDVAALADAFPEAPVILNHCGQGIDMDGEDSATVFRAWRDALQEVARRPNITCKVGGLGLPFWGFRLEDRADPIGYLELAELWRPYVETSIEAFGSERCMMESDYPPDARSCGFVPLWNALKHITRSASTDDKAALFHGTAARVDRIAPP